MARVAERDGPLEHHKILPDTIHAHGVFLHQPRPDEAHGLAINGHRAGVRKTWSVERWFDVLTL